MSYARSSWAVLGCLACSLWLLECQPPATPTESQQEQKGETSSGTDASTDAGTDAGTDAAPDAAPLLLTTPCAQDIEGDFKQLPTTGALLAFHDGDVFAGDTEFQYVFSNQNQFGVNNHFQGVQRYGRHLYLTGGDLKIQQGQLFVLTLGSGPLTGPWGSNRQPDGSVPKEDSVTSRLDATFQNFWHAGGIARHDQYLAIPVENNTGAGKKGATLAFYDLTYPAQPRLLDTISMTSETVAYAVGLTRLSAKGKYLLVRWNDKALTFFTSRSPTFTDGFDDTKAVSWDTKQLKVSVPEVGLTGIHGQGISLLTQCDGKLYALMNENTNRLPTDRGTNYLELYRVTFPNNDTSQLPTVEKIGSRSFDCSMQWCNFTAAGGAHIDHKGRLLFYSVPLYRDHPNRTIQLVEFAPKSN